MSSSDVVGSEYGRRDCVSGPRDVGGSRLQPRRRSSVQRSADSRSPPTVPHCYLRVLFCCKFCSHRSPSASGAHSRTRTHTYTQVHESTHTHTNVIQALVDALSSTDPDHSAAERGGVPRALPLMTCPPLHLVLLFFFLFLFLCLDFFYANIREREGEMMG